MSVAEVAAMLQYAFPAFEFWHLDSTPPMTQV